MCPCPMSHIFLTRPIHWFYHLMAFHIYVCGQYVHHSRTPRFLLMIMSTLMWVHDPHFISHVQVLLSCAYKYIMNISSLVSIPLCVPLCSRHDIIDCNLMTFNTMGFGVPNHLLYHGALASQISLYGILYWYIGRPFYMSGMFPYNLGFDDPLSTFSFLSEVSYFMEHIGLSCIDSVAT